MAVIASIATCLIAAALGLRLLQRHRTGRSAHALHFGIALLFTALAALSGVVAHGFGIWPGWLQHTYWFSAAALVGIMSVGTVNLVFRPLATVYNIIMAALLVWLAVGAAGMTPAEPTTVTPLLLTKAPPDVRVPFLIISIAGASVMFVGAAVSWLQTRLRYNLYILAATLLFSMSGSAGGRLGEPSLFYWFQAVAALALYLGVRDSLRVRRRSVGRRVA